MGRLPCLGALSSLENLDKYRRNREEADVSLWSENLPQICET